MKYLAKLAVFTGIFTILLSPAVMAQKQSIKATVDGVGVIKNGNIAAARISAINNALQKAIEEAVQTIVSSSKIEENRDALEENIYSKSSGYTSNYKVLSEKSIGTIYQITLEAQVSTTLLEEDLTGMGLMESKNSVPNILVLIAREAPDGSYRLLWDNESGEEAETGAVEKILTEKIAGSGYTPVKKEEVQVKDDGISLDEYDRPGEETFIYLGNRYNADMILYGKAYSLGKKDKNGMDSNRVHAVVSLSLIDGKNGRTVATSENEEIADRDSVNEAFMETTEILSERVLQQIAAYWQSNSNTVKTVEMNVSGIKSYLNFMSFQESIRNKIKGVQEVRQRGFGAGGIAQLDIILKGNTQSLADELTMISYDGFAIDITETTHDKISVTMKSL